MPIELKIVWEGEAPGVAEHRLSIGAFGEALTHLLSAYRRIASNMMRDAAAAERGRLVEIAKLLDIQIEEIEGNSVGITALCTFRPEAPEILVGVSERASQQLVEAIHEESLGHPYDKSVRKYLAALPPRLMRQEYQLRDNGRVLHEPVVIEQLNLAGALLLELPHLLEFRGSIVGVGFEPGTNEVKIRTEENESLRLRASQALVERAIELRGTAVQGLAVKGKESRLLRLTPLDAAPFVLTDELMERYVFTRWDALLRRLAQ